MAQTVSIIVNASDRSRLERIAGDRNTSPKHAQRARLILRSRPGHVRQSYLLLIIDRSKPLRQHLRHPVPWTQVLAPIVSAGRRIQAQPSSSGPSIPNRASCSGSRFIDLFRLFNFGAEFLNLGFAFLFQPNQLISSLPVGFD